VSIESKGRTTFRIEEIVHTEDAKPLEDLQMAIWGGDRIEAIPSQFLALAGSSGGILLAAFDGDRPAGFAFGILGRRNGRLLHVSHMLGIHPEYQGRGIGEALKLRQREIALAQGLELMTWTYDPLQARNAHFNLRKLGALTRTYLVNYYGDMVDAINSGLPSDRLLVEWWLREPLPEGRRTEPPTPSVTILHDKEGKPALDLAPVPEGVPLRLEVPQSIDRIKAHRLEDALTWRLAAREAFEWAFGQGYAARDFAAGAYVLTREERDPWQ
jgi:predicted GNAT superfamily acetyltransferase